MDTSGDVFDEEGFATELRSQAAYWQKLLYLQDWNIEVRVCRHWEMPDRKTLAESEWYLHRKDAIIKILHPTDLPGLNPQFLKGEESDYDLSLVHELLHLHFAPFDLIDKQSACAQEQAINSISRGLVSLYREPPVPKTPAIPPTGGLGYL